jgi:hypothetical protein
MAVLARKGFVLPALPVALATVGAGWGVLRATGPGGRSRQAPA